jgi:hypothetical protein
MNHKWFSNPFQQSTRKTRHRSPIGGFKVLCCLCFVLQQKILTIFRGAGSKLANQSVSGGDCVHFSICADFAIRNPVSIAMAENIERSMS